MRIYAVGDIHGHLEKLRAAHQRIEADRVRTGDQTALVVHLGDLVDRGPDSRGVIGYLIQGIADGAPWVVLKGNHDQIFSDQLDPEQEPRMGLRSWRSDTMGGLETMRSYGVEPAFWTGPDRVRRDLAKAVPPEHQAFLAGLPLVHETPELLCVHAGIRPGLPLSEQLEEDLLWIRRDFLDDPRDHGKLVVHGHTPAQEPMHCGNRVNLDSGAAYGRALTAAVFEGRTCYILEEDGRKLLKAPS